MNLSVSKTCVYTNVVEGSIKPDKLAAIELSNLDISNAKTIQKQLLRLHAFSRKFPNSGALKRLSSNLHERIVNQKETPDDIEVQVAIATDILVLSPQAAPPLAGIMSHLISLVPAESQYNICHYIRQKLSKVPHNGYFEIWQQRMFSAKGSMYLFDSDDPICKIAARKPSKLWNDDWIEDNDIKSAMDLKQICISEVSESNPVILPEEVRLFAEAIYGY